MPIYEYKCEKGHVFDVLQKITDEALTKCQECGAPAQRVLHPVAVHFKGSGFYNTDYGKKKGGGTPAEGSKESKSADSGSSSESGSSADSGSSSGSGSGDAKATAATAGD